MVESILVKQQKLLLRGVAFLEILRITLLTGLEGLQYTICNATKSELLTKFLKVDLKLTENFQEVVTNGISYQKFTDLQTAALSLACF